MACCFLVVWCKIQLSLNCSIFAVDNNSVVWRYMTVLARWRWMHNLIFITIGSMGKGLKAFSDAP